MGMPDYGLPWRAVGNKVVDSKGRTVLVVYAHNLKPTLAFIVAAVNATQN